MPVTADGATSRTVTGVPYGKVTEVLVPFAGTESDVRGAPPVVEYLSECGPDVGELLSSAPRRAFELVKGPFSRVVGFCKPTATVVLAPIEKVAVLPAPAV